MSNVTRGPASGCELQRPTSARSIGAHLFVAAFALLAMLSSASSSHAQPQGDLQYVEVGKGFPDTFCVTGGSDFVVQTLPSIDDRLVSTKPPVVVPVFILSGANGICNTDKIAGGNDVQVLTPGTAESNRGVIFSAGVNGDAGLCDSSYIALGDDHVLVAAGKSTPRQVGVKAGSDNVLQSSALSDDIATAAICPGADGTLQSSPSGDDHTSTDVRCQQACGAPSITCVVAGTNELLTTPVNAADLRVPYVSTGLDGIAQTPAATSDVQAILVGRGLQGTVCVDSGDNGIAQTSVCGNSRLDVQRLVNQTQVEPCDDGAANSMLPNACRPPCKLPTCGDGVVDGDLDEFCDDGNTINNDDCSRQCELRDCGNGTIEAGEDCDAPSPGTCPSGTCGVACECPVPVCGNGFEEPGEECDDGNTTPCDDCSAECLIAGCGDGIVCPGETCDDEGESTTCDADCTAVDCGDSVRNETAGEECDAGATNDRGPCLSTCKVAICRDGKTCDGAGCTTGPNGGAEDCDDGNNSNRDACVKGCRIAECGDEVVQKEPLSVEDCDPPDLNAICVVGDLDATCNNNADCDIVGVSGLCNVKCDANCQDVGGKSCLDGNLDPGEDCDDGNHSNLDDCTNLCRTAQCGDGFTHSLGAGGEQCDDGNLIPNDECNAECQVACGNGVLDGLCSAGDPLLLGSQCSDDGDCGESTVGSDDGHCALDEECDVGCGTGLVDGTCTAGTVSEPCANNSDCHSPTPGSNDGRCEGGTCGAGCTVLVGGVCTEGALSLECTTNADCDTGGIGNGVCIGRGCGPAGEGSLVCNVDEFGRICSEECAEVECGNGKTECNEECDQGAANGATGSGCDVACMRNVVGRFEVGAATRTQRECPTAWIYETRGATVELERARFTCKDGDAMCDWDEMPDQCTFRIGVCLNRPGIADCSLDPGGIVAWDLRGLRIAREGHRHEIAAERFVDAVAGLAPGAVTPGRCVRGLKGKSCNVPNDFECAPTFGSPNGACDISTGVLFFPALFPFGMTSCATGDVGKICANNVDCGTDDEGVAGECRLSEQAGPCTDALSIEVNAGEALKLRAKARRARGPTDTDRIQLYCQR